jgi:hypothetical protein
MEVIKLNPFSYIHFSYNQELAKNNFKRLVNAFLPFLNFYQPTAKLLTSGMGAAKSWTHMKNIMLLGQQGKWSTTSLEILQLAVTITTVVGMLFQYRMALAMSSGYEMIQTSKSVYNQVQAREYLGATKATLSLARNAVNLASVIIPSPQIIALCLGAQVIAQLYHTAIAAKENGLSIETLAQCGLTVIYSYQLTKQIQLIIALSKIRLLEPFFLSIDKIHPGQSRYSSKNTDEKVNKILKEGRATFDETSGTWSYKYDDGRSAYSLDNAVPVVLGPDGMILLVDGHHDVMASLAVGAQSIPVKVIENWTDVPMDTFWTKAANSGYAYLYDLQGQKRLPPTSFKDLVDDPNRYFAAIAARKLNEGGTMENSVGTDYPLWIKIGKDIPFIEFKISDLMIKKGLIYDYNIEKDPVAWEQFMEKVRAALVENPIDGLRVVTERTYYKDIDLNQYQRL